MDNQQNSAQSGVSIERKRRLSDTTNDAHPIQKKTMNSFGLQQKRPEDLFPYTARGQRLLAESKRNEPTNADLRNRQKRGISMRIEEDKRIEEEKKKQQEIEMKEDIRAHGNSIVYSPYYFDNQFEYRHVILPLQIARWIPHSDLLTEREWRSLGIRQSRGWEHYMVHAPEPHILLFRREKNYAEKYGNPTAPRPEKTETEKQISKENVPDNTTKGLPDNLANETKD